MEADKILSKTIKIVADCLALEPHEVRADSRLGIDLGAESVDLLDLAFRIEKEFNIRGGRARFFPEDVLNNAYYSDGIRLTAAGLARVKQRMPHLDFDRPDLAAWSSNPRLDNFVGLQTVADIAAYVGREVAAGLAVA